MAARRCAARVRARAPAGPLRAPGLGRGRRCLCLAALAAGSSERPSPPPPPSCARSRAPASSPPGPRRARAPRPRVSARPLRPPSARPRGLKAPPGGARRGGKASRRGSEAPTVARARGSAPGARRVLRWRARPRPLPRIASPRLSFFAPDSSPSRKRPQPLSRSRWRLHTSRGPSAPGSRPRAAALVVPQRCLLRSFCARFPEQERLLQRSARCVFGDCVEAVLLCVLKLIHAESFPPALP